MLDTINIGLVLLSIVMQRYPILDFGHNYTVKRYEFSEKV